MSTPIVIEGTVPLGRRSRIPTYPAAAPVCARLREHFRPKEIRLSVRYLGFSDPTWALRSSLRLGFSVPAFHAWRPHPPIWFPPNHFPAEPVIGSVFGIQGSSCLGPRPSELSLLDSPGLPPSTSAGSPVRAFPHAFRTGIGHRLEGRKSWHSNIPLESASCGTQISTVSPFALATALLVARPLS